MKLKKLRKLQYPNLELQIIKLYRKKKTLSSNTEKKSVEILLNKIANVIYLYHITGKTILFLGFSSHLNKTLIGTKHTLVPEFMWQNNMLTSFSFSNKKVKIPKTVLKLKAMSNKKVDLIIINNAEKNKIAFKESYFARIPSIILTDKIEIPNIKSSYNSTGSYHFFSEKAENKDFFCTFIHSVLLKAKQSIKQTLV